MDDNRGTGRTKKMLLKAVSTFLSGRNVLVTGHNWKYSRRLQGMVCSVCESLGIPITYTGINCIEFNGCYIKFDTHDSVVGSKYRGAIYDVFSDHFCR